jgi:putative FmdB family regulatory protein
MPTYEFRCPLGHEFEVFYRSISRAEAQAACPKCGQLGERMMSAGAGLVFKGSGFYLTDYGKNAHREKGTVEAKGNGAKSDGAGGESAKGEGKGESAKSESGSSTESSSGSSKGESSGSTASESSKSESKKTESKAAESKPAPAPPKPSAGE